jgi:peptide/nickel transport system permease protein
VIRSLRAEILKVSDADYVITARAKGLSERRIRRMHVFRNALPPAVTILAVNIGFLVGGTVVVEEVFGLGGVGALMLSGINARDFPIVQGVTLFFAFAVIITNFVGEMIQAALDPRIESS